MAELSVVISTDDRAFGSAITTVVRASGIPVGILDLENQSDQTPAVAVVDVRGQGTAQGEIERVRKRWPAVDIVAIASVSEPENILKAMRAGANEFFVWPEGSVEAPESIQEGIREAIKKTSPSELCRSGWPRTVPRALVLRHKGRCWDDNARGQLRDRAGTTEQTSNLDCRPEPVHR